MARLPVKHYTGKNRFRKIRMAVLVLILAISTALGLLHQFMKDGAPVSVDALCPFGAIESAYTLIFTGVIIKRVAVSSFILFFATIILALVFRRAFCGLICPLGTIQELSANLGKKIMKAPAALPALVDRPGRFIKYIVLAAAVFFSAKAGELVIRPYDPWVAYHHLLSSDIFTELLAGFVVLLITLAGSFFYNRVFCKYLCPMGAFLAFFARAGRYGIKRDPAACTGCGACNRACPVQVDVMGGTRIDSPECISCYECVSVCPGKDTLSISAGKPGATIALPAALGSLVLVFALLIAATTATGHFQWKNPSLAAQVEAAGKFDPDMIKGRMTLGEVIQSSGIPAGVFESRYNIVPEDFHRPLKDIKEKYHFEVEDLRDFVKDYIKMPEKGGNKQE